jgi:hypothetical protein
VTGKEREYFANVWRDNPKKKKKAAKDRHYSFTVSNLLPTWTTTSLSVGLGRWVERTKESEKKIEQSSGRIRSATE